MLRPLHSPAAYDPISIIISVMSLVRSAFISLLLSAQETKLYKRSTTQNKQVTYDVRYPPCFSQYICALNYPLAVSVCLINNLYLTSCAGVHRVVYRTIYDAAVGPTFASAFLCRLLLYQHYYIKTSIQPLPLMSTDILLKPSTQYMHTQPLPQTELS